MMASDHITARNRANAAKSTGPKTAAGKAVVARNATRHGITGRPDPEELKTWLGIILNRPEITPRDLMPDTELGLRALRLAEAEVRFATVRDALQAHERVDDQMPAIPFMLLQQARETIDLAEEIIDFAASSKTGFSLEVTLVNSEQGPYVTGQPIHEKRRRLLKRYLGEARTQRRRAFEAWVKARTLLSASKPLNPETKPLHPAGSTPQTAS